LHLSFALLRPLFLLFCLSVYAQEAVLCCAERPKRIYRPRAKMLHDINRYAVVAYTHNGCARVLQLKKILLIFVYFCFVNLPNLILIALAKRLAHFNPADAYCCMTVPKCMQFHTKSLAGLALQHLRELVGALCPL
jgi:hypothetical protein